MIELAVLATAGLLAVLASVAVIAHLIRRSTGGRGETGFELNAVPGEVPVATEAVPSAKTAGPGQASVLPETASGRYESTIDCRPAAALGA